jgi:hypothetical protein
MTRQRSQTGCSAAPMYLPRSSEGGAEVTSYRCVVATRRGGPEVLEVVERELRDPGRTRFGCGCGRRV